MWYLSNSIPIALAEILIKMRDLTSIFGLDYNTMAPS